MSHVLIVHRHGHSPRVRGFTVLEIFIVGALLSVLLGAIILTLMTSQRSYTSSEMYLHVQEEARRALDAMTKELHAAGGVIVPAGDELTFQYILGYNLAAPCPTDPADDLRCFGAVDVNRVPQFNWSVRYRLNGTQLVREILNAGVVQPGTQVLANNISTLSFTYNPNPTQKTITVQLVVTKVSSQLPGGSMGTTPIPLTTTVRLRN